MSRRIIDLSVALENDVPADLGPGPSIEYVDHDQSAPGILSLFPGLKKDDLPEARIAWTGSNALLDRRPKQEIKIGLWAFTWTNPHPEKEIASLDVLSADKECDPFLVAVTVIGP